MNVLLFLGKERIKLKNSIFPQPKCTVSIKKLLKCAENTLRQKSHGPITQLVNSEPNQVQYDLSCSQHYTCTLRQRGQNMQAGEQIHRPGQRPNWRQSRLDSMRDFYYLNNTTCTVAANLRDTAANRQADLGRADANVKQQKMHEKLSSFHLYWSIISILSFPESCNKK